MIRALITCFILTIILIPLLRPAATRIGLVDKPGGRKQHQGQIPLTGGFAMCIAFISGILLLLPHRDHNLTFIVCTLGIMLLGLFDDYFSLPAKPRLAIQFLIALMLATLGQDQLSHLGNLLFLGDINLGVFSSFLTIIAVVGIINAVNMFDGLDGLAGILTATQLTMLIALATRVNLLDDAVILSLLLACIIGFLIYNFRIGNMRARAFMGDAGSLLIGFVLAWYLINLSQAPHPAAPPVTFLWVMALPLYDLFAVAIRRMKSGHSPFQAGREHLHYLLRDQGFTVNQTVFLMGGLNLLCGLMGLISTHLLIPEGVMFILFLLGNVLYYQLTHLLRHRAQILSEPIID